MRTLGSKIRPLYAAKTKSYTDARRLLQAAKSDRSQYHPKPSNGQTPTPLPDLTYVQLRNPKRLPTAPAPNSVHMQGLGLLGSLPQNRAAPAIRRLKFASAATKPQPGGGDNPFRGRRLNLTLFETRSSGPAVPTAHHPGAAARASRNIIVRSDISPPPHRRRWAHTSALHTAHCCHPGCQNCTLYNRQAAEPMFAPYTNSKAPLRPDSPAVGVR